MVIKILVMQNISVNGWTVDILTDETMDKGLFGKGLSSHPVPAQAPAWAVGCLQRLL